MQWMRKCNKLCPPGVSAVKASWWGNYDNWIEYESLHRAAWGPVFANVSQTLFYDHMVHKKHLFQRIEHLSTAPSRKIVTGGQMQQLGASSVSVVDGSTVEDTILDRVRKPPLCYMGAYFMCAFRQLTLLLNGHML